jgi:hypothetical protein
LLVDWLASSGMVERSAAFGISYLVKNPHYGGRIFHGVHLMGVCLMGVDLMGVHHTRVDLTGVLMGVYLTGV